MLSIAVNIRVAGNHNNVDQSPDSASSKGQEHNDAGGGVSGVESVDAKTSKHNAEDKSNQPTILFFLGGLIIIVCLVGFRL